MHITKQCPLMQLTDAGRDADWLLMQVKADLY